MPLFTLVLPTFPISDLEVSAAPVPHHSTVSSAHSPFSGSASQQSAAGSSEITYFFKNRTTKLLPLMADNPLAPDPDK